MKKYSNILFFSIVLFSLLLIGGFIFALYQASNLQTTSGLLGNVSIFILLIIDFIIGVNIIEHFFSFKKKYQNLEKIDADLEELKTNPNDEKAITSFSEYNCILTDALPIPDFVFRSYEDEIVRLWKNR